MPPADPPSAGPPEPARNVVWTAGSGLEDPCPKHPVRRWLGLLVLVGACSFLLAYAGHTLLGGTTPAGAPGSLWLPERLAPDACAGS